MRILIGVDGSPYSDAALNEIAQRQWPNGSEILVIHAYELPLAATPEVWVLPPNYYETIEAAARTQAETIVKSATDKLTNALGDSVSITGKSVLGSPKRAILDEAEAWKSDLIVVGSHGYPTWERLLLGSVSQAVVSHARCSVEVVRAALQKKVAA